MHDPYQALKIPGFALFVTARGLITFAIQMLSLVIAWQVYDLSQDPLALGLVGLCEAISALGIAPWAGHIIDNGHSKRKIIAGGHLLLILSTLSLAFYSYRLKAHSIGEVGHWELSFIYLANFLTGLARGFLGPLSVSLFAEIVPSSKVLNASTWNSSLLHLARVLGPAAGGPMYLLLGNIGSYLFCALLIVLSLVVMLLIPLEKTIRRTGREAAFWPEFKSGLKFVKEAPALWQSMALDMLAVLFGGAVALLPIFTSQIYQQGPEILGLLRAGPAIGATIIGPVLAFLPPMEKAGRWMLVSVFGFGLCMLALGLSQSWVVGFMCLILSGAFDNISVIVRQSILQLVTPKHLLGKVAAVRTVFIGSSNEIGAFESGLSAKLLGAVGSVLFGSSVTMSLAILAFKKAHPLRDFNLRDWEKKSSS